MKNFKKRSKIKNKLAFSKKMFIMQLNSTKAIYEK